ncbi:protein FAM167A [Platysternon megacephalum]|uniref:Protein FAM167A n=1 Tax=Platysternon megacephalum TaxID=55544 RepID=A0A4D9DYF5_9SAUR|nr:protein FAM167A [Platysternon megacephalum]
MGRIRRALTAKTRHWGVIGELNFPPQLHLAASYGGLAPVHLSCSLQQHAVNTVLLTWPMPDHGDECDRVHVTKGICRINSTLKEQRLLKSMCSPVALWCAVSDLGGHRVDPKSRD